MDEFDQVAATGNITVIGALIAAALLVILGIIDLALKWRAERAARDAVAAAANQATSVSETDPGQLQQYSGIDFASNWEALASLASAIKDLDRSSRLFMLALAFVAVAGATLGLESIGAGIASIGS